MQTDSVKTRLEIVDDLWQKIDSLFLYRSYQRLSQADTQLLSTFSLLNKKYYNTNLKKSFSFTYFPETTISDKSNRWQFIIFKENHLPIYSDKLFAGSSWAKQVISNKYQDMGEFFVQASAFFEFLYDQMSKLPLKALLFESTWSEEYYKPWYDGTDL